MADKKRWNLIKFRGSLALTQSEMADRIGVKRQTYSLVELGKRRGSEEFWSKIKNTFDLNGDDMWSLMQIVDKEATTHGQTCE